MCGIVGIFSHKPVAADLYDSLIHLQHRGQDACGILTTDGSFHIKHGLGLVRESISAQDIVRLEGRVGIAHVRYPTAGGYSETEIQPLWTEQAQSLALVHNGNLVNAADLAAEIKALGRTLKTSLDSEALLVLLSAYLEQKAKPVTSELHFFEALCLSLSTLFKEVQGSYSVLSLLPEGGLIAFRDPHGIRPLVWGQRLNQDGTLDYIFASETTPFYALGFKSKGDLKPGEVIYLSPSGQLYQNILTTQTFSPCIFEYVYFARPDATLDDVNVYRARLRMGQNLAHSWKKRYPDVLPDVVIPAPSTANTAALAFASELGVRYSEGLYKNPFIARTFIMPNEHTRSRQVRYKLTPQKTEINKKKVLILDDSIVRGTTSREIVKMVREFGAKEIYFASTCPPMKHPCFYGIDIPSRKKLIAAHQTEEEVRQFLGVDRLLFQTQKALVEAVTRRGKHHIKTPCMACMDGHYISGNITEEKIKSLEMLRLGSETELQTELGELS